MATPGTLTVFAQRAEARIDLGAWRAHAAQFFATEIDLAETMQSASPSGRDRLVEVPRATLHLTAPSFGVEGEVACAIRAVTDDDWEAATAAEARSHAGGMGALARRCMHVVRVGPADDMRTALLMAAIVAGVELGPILTADGAEIFGVRTARLKLER